jgi:hypothetical protein
MKTKTLYSLPVPTFASGFASAFDMYGTSIEYVFDKFLKKSDEEALRSDWEIIGEDMRIAVKKAKSKNNHKNG